jgi:hypothetical protein
MNDTTKETDNNTASGAAGGYAVLTLRELVALEVLKQVARNGKHFHRPGVAARIAWSFADAYERHREA